MADDDDPQMTLGGSGPYPETSEPAEPEEPAPPPAPAQQEPESAEGAPEDPQIAKQRAAYMERLEHNYQQISGREQEMMSQLGESIQRLSEAVNAPSPELHLQALPAPPTEQQKGNASEFIMNLLKFGALTAVAFGSGGRGFGHNAIWKSAVGAALQGYAQGRKDIADRSMQLWEKNREIINDANKQQIELYNANLKDSRLSLQQKLTLNNQVAAAYRDYRNWESTKAQNLRDHEAALKDQERVHRDNVRWQRTQRDHIYNIMGKSNQTASYWAWVSQQSGGKINITPTSSEEDIEKAEKEYPPSKFLEYQQEEDLKKIEKKAEAAARGRKKGEAEAEGTTDDDQAKKDAAKKKVDEITSKILPGL